MLLAAGAGRRLRADGRLTSPKPLVRLLGLSLLERAILTARAAAGCPEVVIALGCDAPQIQKALGDGRRLGVRPRYALSPDWERGNGASALAARPFLRGCERFLLLMSDHVLDPEIPKALLAHGDALARGEADVLLAVDREPGPHIDLEDATKVRLDRDGRITAIGKGLDGYDAIDTGAFLCTPALFDALEEALRAGDGSLSGGVRALARRGRVRAVDVTGRFWIDVDTPQALRTAERLLLRQLRQKPTDGPVARHLNRPLSIRLSRWLVRTPLTPTQLSWLSFLVAAAGAVALALPGYPALALGGLLAQLSSVLDGCDGEVARLKLQTSERGGWLDAVLDRYADALLVGGLTHHAWLAAPGPGTAVWLWGLAALSGVLLNSYTADKYDAFLKRALEEGRRPLRLGRDVRLFLIFLGALLNAPLATLVALALLNHGEVLRRLWLLGRA